MNVRNCKKCGRLFNYVAGASVCPACRDQLEEKFQEVKKFIQENPGVGVAEVSEACDVETAQIRQWVREERLEFSSESGVDLACEKCGVAICTGRFCTKCKSEMINSMNRTFARPVEQKKETNQTARMRYLDN